MGNNNDLMNKIDQSLIDNSTRLIPYKDRIAKSGAKAGDWVSKTIDMVVDIIFKKK